VDDHSEENVLKVLDSFNDARIKYLKSNKIPSNANVCRNIGIQNATGEYVAMLDSDDEWLPLHLESKLKFLLKNNADGVFGSFWRDNGTEKELILSRQLFKSEKMINYLLADGNAVTPSHLYKTICAKSIMWDETLIRHQDYDFSVRFANQYKFLPVHEATTIVHWNKGESRLEHYTSQKIFIEKHRAQISPKIYHAYHASVYNKIAKRNDLDSSLINYFKKESARYIHDLTLNEYLAAYKLNKGVLGRFLLRISFLFRVIIGK
jgi:glycosyltransferase involved in cell wall biosynthesis